MDNGRAEDADKMEDLAVELKELVLMLRGNTPKDVLYAKMYNARHTLGTITAKYGVGVPSRQR